MTIIDNLFIARVVDKVRDWLLEICEELEGFRLLCINVGCCYWDSQRPRRLKVSVMP